MEKLQVVAKKITKEFTVCPKCGEPHESKFADSYTAGTAHHLLYIGDVKSVKSC
jgi:hypothetical protein